MGYDNPIAMPLKNNSDKIQGFRVVFHDQDLGFHWHYSCGVNLASPNSPSDQSLLESLQVRTKEPYACLSPGLSQSVIALSSRELAPKRATHSRRLGENGSNSKGTGRALAASEGEAPGGEYSLMHHGLPIKPYAIRSAMAQTIFIRPVSGAYEWNSRGRRYPEAGSNSMPPISQQSILCSFLAAVGN